MGCGRGLLAEGDDDHGEGEQDQAFEMVVVSLGNQSTTTTQTAAYTYLAARILYVPAYALGWKPWRSAIWAVGFIATLTMIIASLI